MTLQGRVTYDTDPMSIAVHGMTTQFYLLNFYANNIAHADVPGYQRKVPVVTSFAQYLGLKGIDTATDTSVGRIFNTGNPLDFALNTKGYFQKLHSDGRVELTRDGRFQLDKNGNLLSEDKMPILATDGKPIKLPFIPQSLDQIKVNSNGVIEVLNKQNGQTTNVAQIGVASSQGSLAAHVDMRQGYVEESNVFLHEEFVGLVVPKRNFEANRQIFLTQNEVLSKLIQEMGRVQ